MISLIDGSFFRLLFAGSRDTILSRLPENRKRLYHR